MTCGTKPMVAVFSLLCRVAGHYAAPLTGLSPNSTRDARAPEAPDA